MTKKEEMMDQPLMTQILEYWQIIRQNKWWIFFLTLGLTLAAVVVIALLPDTYQATTTILVDPQKVSDQYVAPELKENLTDRLQTISQEVMSATGLQELIDRHHLYSELRGSKSREQIIEHMRKAISIEVKHASGNGPGAFTITYQGRHPGVVAEVTNQLAGRFIEFNLQSREQLATVTNEFLGDQLQGAKRNLETQENTIRDFKMSHLGETPDTLPANLGTLAQLRATYQANNDALNRLEQERIELTRLPAPDIRAGRPNVQLSERGRLELQKLQLEDQLMALRRRYTPTHPEVVEAATLLKQVKEQLKNLPQTPNDDAAASPSEVRLEIISRETNRLNEEQKRIAMQIAAYQTRVDAMPLREQQLTDLSRDYDVSKQEYHNLLQKRFAAGMASDLERKQKAERFTVLDAAQPPERPVKPNRRMLIVSAFFGALAFSILLTTVKEKMDNTIHAEKQLEDMLPAPVAMLALIPTIETPADQKRRARFAIFALFTSLLACLIMAQLLWRIYPSL